jgi:large subunit ribosomal protein L27
MGKDHTLFAMIDGQVVFKRKRKNRSFVSVEPLVGVETAVAEAPVKKEAPKAEKPKTEVKEEASKADAKKEVEAVAKEEKAKKEAKKEEAPKAEAKSSDAKDDLKELDGVGPKLEEVFNAAGIATFEKFAATSIDELNKILEEAGSRYASKDPAPWVEQAKELAKEK